MEGCDCGEMKEENECGEESGLKDHHGLMRW